MLGVRRLAAQTAPAVDSWLCVNMSRLPRLSAVIKTSSRYSLRVRSQASSVRRGPTVDSLSVRDAVVLSVLTLVVMATTGVAMVAVLVEILGGLVELAPEDMVIISAMRVRLIGEPIAIAIHLGSFLSWMLALQQTP